MSDAQGALTEQRLRAAGAAIHEGRAYDPVAVANVCIEAADQLARQSLPERYYLDVLDDNDDCPTCGEPTCHHEHPCHCCKACR